MDQEEFDKRLNESRRVYDYLLQEFRSRFDWLDLDDEDIDPNIVGLSTVLMDDYINHQFIEKFNKAPDLKDEWTRFFGFVEELLQSQDPKITETIDTTLLEVLASEAYIPLESVLPYCGCNTRRSIYRSIVTFYGKPQRAEELSGKYIA